MAYVMQSTMDRAGICIIHITLWANLHVGLYIIGTTEEGDSGSIIILTKAHRAKGCAVASEVFLIFTTQLYIHVLAMMIQLFSYLVKREVL